MRNQRDGWPAEKAFGLYSDNRNEIPKIIRRISGEKGEELVRTGRATRIENDEGTAVLAYQMTVRCVPAARQLERAVVLRSSPPSCTAFSRAEIDALAGTKFRDGRSRTTGLSDIERARRVLNGQRDEDLVEAAQNKFAQYPQTH